MDIRIVDSAHAGDICLKNDPFPVYGRLIPSLADGKWSYLLRYAPADDVREMCFPQEDYDFIAMKDDHVFVAAYEGAECIGLAVLQCTWFRYLYLADLKVSTAHRRKGVAKAMMDKALETANQMNYNGIYAVCQDNNLDACKFYLSYGFEIGGFDNRIYRGTSQEGKADILFYLDR